jgi:hypothetical protein
MSAYANIISDNKNKIIIYLLLGVVITLCLTNGLLYYNLKSKMDIESEFSELYNKSNIVDNYYLKLNDMYFDVREEYKNIYEEYSRTRLEYSLFEKEYNEIWNYKKNIILDKDKSIKLNPKKNVTIIYEVPFSGYIEIFFNSSEETYFWIGSSSIESIYYSRYPSFPELKKSGSFKVPVLPDVIIYIANPSEEKSLDLFFNINFIY